MKRVRLVLATLLVKALLIAAVASPAAAAPSNVGKNINVTITCNDSPVHSIYLKRYYGEDGWVTSWGSPLTAHNVTRATFQFTIQNGDYYKINAGCKYGPLEIFDEGWGTTVTTGWVDSSDANSQFYCNSLEDYKLWGRGWIKAFNKAYKASQPPSYGQCAKVG